MTVTFKIDVSNALKKIGMIEAGMANKVQEGVMDAAFYVESEVKASIAGRRGEPTSVDTGRFLQSVSAMPTGFGAAEVKTEVEYAQYLEFGTRRIAARQHFNNSRIRTEERVKDIIEKKIDEII